MFLSLDELGSGRAVPSRTYGIIGWPLTYTLSPVMHGAALAHYKIDAVYRPFPLPVEKWPEFVQGLSSGRIPLMGLNVTVPHKERVLEIPSVKAEEGTECGSANVLTRGDQGWSASSTDGRGLLEDLDAQGISWRDRTVLVLGAGGAAKAAVFAFGTAPEPPREIFVFNRSVEKARALARGRFSTKVTAVDDPSDAAEASDLCVNATSLGLKEGDPMPLDRDSFRSETSFYDMVYHRDTPFLQRARSVGSKASGGSGMLVNQGALAFEKWFSLDLKKVDYSPTDLRKVMAAALRGVLSERTL